jgi:peptide-methionine (R)-S-oxide reductase
MPNTSRGEIAFTVLQRILITPYSVHDWPSFTKPVEPAHVEERSDGSHGMSRTEVRSSPGDSHLGHVFDDGPKDASGLCYCINFALLRFIPLDELDGEG